MATIAPEIPARISSLRERDVVEGVCEDLQRGCCAHNGSPTLHLHPHSLIRCPQLGIRGDGSCSKPDCDYQHPNPRNLYFQRHWAIWDDVERSKLLYRAAFSLNKQSCPEYGLRERCSNLGCRLQHRKVHRASSTTITSVSEQGTIELVRKIWMDHRGTQTLSTIRAVVLSSAIRSCYQEYLSGECGDEEQLVFCIVPGEDIEEIAQGAFKAVSMFVWRTAVLCCPPLMVFLLGV
eukprot:TRINITY_DN7203_c0_g1_i2.p1 TRINITY_DN7203_c0_g1~~TRINITY_DN7203_c0_g1_i2.p1  ORF type:complete len:245 (+),score=2.99 TRINITY_DN7203_c0_g1_i2:33-737(+)